jgi:hypothetical protein
MRIALARQRFITATNTHGTRQTMFRIKPRAQNMPKTKVDESKVVAITEDRKKVLMAKNID